MASSLRLLPSLSGLLFAVAGVSHAAILVNEDFSSYGNGSINGQAASSVNLTGNWFATTDAFGNFSVNGGRLDFSRTSNATVAGVPKYARAGFASNTATTTDSNELWGYGRIATGTTRGAYFSTSLFYLATNSNTAPFVNQLTYGIDGGKAFIATSNGRVANGDTSVTFSNQTFSSTTYDSGAHTYLVQLVNLGTTDDLFQLWVDPDLSGGIANLGAPAVAITVGNLMFGAGSHVFNSNVYTQGTNSYSLGEVRASFLLNQSADGQSGWMDDFRVATSFEEIAAIPEPSAPLAGTVGMLALAMRRRRDS